MFQKIPVSQIVGDLSELNAPARSHPIDITKLDRRMQRYSGHLNLTFSFGLKGSSQHPPEVLIAQPLEDSECLVAVNPDVKVFYDYAIECFATRPMRVTVISDDAAIRAWVRALQKLGLDCLSIYSADLDRFPYGRNATWSYQISRAMAVPPYYE